MYGIAVAVILLRMLGLPQRLFHLTHHALGGL